MHKHLSEEIIEGMKQLGWFCCADLKKMTCLGRKQGMCLLFSLLWISVTNIILHVLEENPRLKIFPVK